MSFMNELINCHLIDTNILVYAYDCTDAKKYGIALKLLEKCWKKEAVYAISVQNLAEFFVIITKKVPHPLSIEEAGQIISDICSFSGWKVLNYNPDTLNLAIELYKKQKKHFWDAVLAATMIKSGITEIYTENYSDFQVFEDIRVKNPFS
ncbi:PIN domain-containing protein [Candidatus Woesearchaeota archaeon]|nr:PIN domain-containing protein [Candidatus Woesearchaeota archaeon]